MATHLKTTSVRSDGDQSVGGSGLSPLPLPGGPLEHLRLLQASSGGAGAGGGRRGRTAEMRPRHRLLPLNRGSDGQDGSEGALLPSDESDVSLHLLQRQRSAGVHGGAIANRRSLRANHRHDRQILHRILLVPRKTTRK